MDPAHQVAEALRACAREAARSREQFVLRGGVAPADIQGAWTLPALNPGSLAKGLREAGRAARAAGCEGAFVVVDASAAMDQHGIAAVVVEEDGARRQGMPTSVRMVCLYTHEGAARLDDDQFYAVAWAHDAAWLPPAPPRR